MAKYSISDAIVLWVQAAHGPGSLTLTLLTVSKSLLFLKDLFAPAQLRLHFTDFKWNGIQSVCGGWWIAENVLDVSLCFVLVTLAVKHPLTPVSINQAQKLGDFSCILEQFPEETNEAGQTSICGSEWGGWGWDRDRADDRCRGRNRTGFGRRAHRQLYRFYKFLLFNLGFLL